MAHIFISYSRVDRDFTDRLVDRLRRVYGLSNIWYDDELHGGDHWWAEILRQIVACDVFVYLLSNEAVTSPYCHAEFVEATRLQKPIVTVQIRDRTQLSAELSQIQYVDMKQGIDDDSLARLIGSIQKQLTLPKKRRALWRPETALPVVPAAEPTVARAEVDTPVLTMHRSEDRGALRTTIIGAVIAGIFGIIAVIVGVVLPTALNPKATETPPAQTLVAVLMTSTSIASTPSSVPSNTPTVQTTTTRAPSETPAIAAQTTPALMSTDSAIPLGFAGNPVTSNAQWVYDNIKQNERWFQGLEMVLVPAGCFRMGNDPEAYDGDTTIGVVDGGQQCFDQPFYISSSEITNGAFEHFGCTGVHPSNWTDDLRPREDVSWVEVGDCIARIDQQLGGGWRLPTEAEWEYAARGPDDLIYPWGNDWNPNNLVWSNNSSQKTALEGSNNGDVSWVGAYDMAGNVREWTSSTFKPYPYVMNDGRESNTANDSSRVLRGASWDDNVPDSARAASRSGGYPIGRQYVIGFRVVLPYHNP